MKSSLYLKILGLAGLAGCAHMEAPPGGPVDSKRPFVAAVFPAPDSTMVGSDLKVQIAFSEWMAVDIERGKVYLNPPLPRKLKTDLSGNLLEVTSKARLDTGTTYLLGILGSVKDLNGLVLESPLELTFSTGKHLDSGRVSGRIASFQGKATPGSYIALYPRGLELRKRFQHLTQRGDSTVVPEAQPNAAKERPAYIAPTDSLGHFNLRAVKPGRYGLLGFQDINANLQPEVGTEALAIGPTLEISALGDVKTLTLFAYDTVPLKLIDAKWVHGLSRGKLSDGTIHLKFNRAPHPLLSQIRESYSIRKVSPREALNQGAKVPVLDICLHPQTGEIEIHTSPLEVDSQYVVLCQGLKDIYGNAMDTAHSQVSFRINQAIDTSKTDLIFFGPRKVNGEPEKLGSDRLIPSRGFAIYYPRLLNDSTLADFRKRLIVKVDTQPIAVTLNRANHHTIGLQFPALQLKGQKLQFNLKPDSSKVLTDTNLIQMTPDTVKSTIPAVPPKPMPPILKTIATFTLADASKLGGLKFKQEASAFGSHLVLRSLSSPAEYSHLTPASEDFIRDSLPEGWYAVDYFRDANGDGIWNPGSLSPWNVQEPYVAWADSVEVKAGIIAEGGQRPSRAGAALTDPEARLGPGAKSDSQESKGTALLQKVAPLEGATPAIFPGRKLAWPPVW
jgi:Bacterial Ig-like domain